MRCSRRDARDTPPCTCLMKAFRSFPDKPSPSEGCASPDCLVREIDSITLHQFVAAITGPHDEEADREGAEDRA